MNERATTVTLGAKFFVLFLLGDLLLLAAAALIWNQANRPMTAYEIAGFGACVAFGAWLGVWPFRLRQQAELKLAETAELTDTLAQIGRLEDAAQRIDMATGQWQTVQEHAGRTMTAAREIADRMAVEQREFRAFMEKADETERAHLRLEVNKLRRAEGDWLQALVRTLDHIYALYMAGVRSGQPHLAEQFAQFQNACREAVRRVGLVPVVATPGAAFNAELNQLPDPEATVPEGSTVMETLATGYAFQGQLLRRAVVAVQPPSHPLPATSDVESFGSFSSSNAPSAAPGTFDSAPPTDALPETTPPEPTPAEPAVTEAPPPETPPAPDQPTEPAGAPIAPAATEPATEPRGERPGPGVQPQLPL